MKAFKKAAALLLVIALMAVMAGCGFNTKDFVTQSLDYSLKGKVTSEYAKMTGKTVAELEAQHKQKLDAMYDEFLEQFGYQRSDVSSESLEKTMKGLERVNDCLKYEVKSVEQVDGGYKATVEYYPLMITQMLTKEALLSTVAPILQRYIAANDTSKESYAACISEVVNAIMGIYNTMLENPIYGEAQTAVLDVKLDGKIASIAEEQIKDFGNLLLG